MDTLSASLQPYKATVAFWASVTTIAQFFSGTLICRDIYKNKSTAGIPAMPFIGGLVIGVLMIEYSLMLQDSAMLMVNVAAVALNALYVGFYYIFSENRTVEVHKPFSYGLGLIAVLLSYVKWESSDLIEYRYGLILTVLMLLLMGSPLLDISDIIKKKDASSIPFPITSSATIVTFLWLLYGIILLNDFMVVQNALGFMLCIAQLILYWMYPQKSIPEKKD